MNIYLVERTDDWGYDETDSEVIVANSNREAKEEFGYPEVTCTKVGVYTGPNKKPFCVLSSFNAG